MNCILKIFVLCLLWGAAVQADSGTYMYVPNQQHPYGQLNPAAPPAVKDFAALIGRAECISTARIDQNNWAKPQAMTWVFKYIMNGMAVQDETHKVDGSHSGSIRQFNPETGKWLVHYYTTNAVPDVLPAWQGGAEDGNLVFRKAQQAPNGMEGKYRLTFYNISADGYEWKGEWVDAAEQVVYPTWKISCVKQHDKG